METTIVKNVSWLSASPFKKRIKGELALNQTYNSYYWLTLLEKEEERETEREKNTETEGQWCPKIKMNEGREKITWGEKEKGRITTHVRITLVLLLWKKKNKQQQQSYKQTRYLKRTFMGLFVGKAKAVKLVKLEGLYWKWQK